MASIAASVTQIAAQSEGPSRKSSLAPPVAKPRHSGHALPSRDGRRRNLRCAAHMLPCGPSRSRSCGTAVATIASGMCALFGQITPGRRAGPRSRATSPNGPRRSDRRRPGSAVPTRRARERSRRERRHGRTLRGSPGAQMLGEVEHVAFRGGQRIEPAAAVMDDDDDLASRRYLIARRVLSFTSTFQPSSSSRAAQPTFSLNSSISLFSIALHRARRRRRPVLSSVGLACSTPCGTSPDRPRSLPDARAR